MNRILSIVPFLAGTAATVHAQPYEGSESERTTYLEFRVGFYRPEVDSEFTPVPNLERPYERIFGDDRPPMLQLLYERQLFEFLGTLSTGVALGYWEVEGEGVATVGAEAEDKTAFRMLPLQAQVSYRFDVLEDSLPLVPVARVGVDYFLWEVLDGAGERARFADGDEAAGATWGWHYTVGVHLLLDFFAPEMALDFDREAGVNGSYLTFEYQRSQIDDFGSSDSFRLGDNTFFVGLSLNM